ncbi:MAG: hypothetical protein ACW98J_05035 [Candidatus Thorarchaeota archaeon]|jgi:uncharacterized membrane protein YhaH (DUF805 family)
MNENGPELQLSQFDRRQFYYLNLSCIFVVLAILSLIANPVYGSIVSLLFVILTILLIRACFTHEVVPADEISPNSNQ